MARKHRTITLLLITHSRQGRKKSPARQPTHTPHTINYQFYSHFSSAPNPLAMATSANSDACSINTSTAIAIARPLNGRHARTVHMLMYIALSVTKWRYVLHTQLNSIAAGMQKTAADHGLAEINTHKHCARFTMSLARYAARMYNTHKREMPVYCRCVACVVVGGLARLNCCNDERCFCRVFTRLDWR